VLPFKKSMNENIFINMIFSNNIAPHAFPIDALTYVMFHYIFACCLSFQYMYILTVVVFIKILKLFAIVFAMYYDKTFISFSSSYVIGVCSLCKISLFPSELP